jgi:hypothetical protein
MHKRIREVIEPKPKLEDIYMRDAVIEALSQQNAMLHQSLDRIWQELALYEYNCGLRGVNA